MAIGFRPLPLAFTQDSGPLSFTPPSDNLVLSTTAPSVAWTDHRDLSPDRVNLVLTSVRPTVSNVSSGEISPPSIHILISTTAPTVDRTIVFANITVPQGNLVFTSVAPLVSYATNLSIPAAGVVFSTSAPEVHQDVAIPALVESHIYLVELQYHDGASVQTVYLSTDDFTSAVGDTPSLQYYESRVEDPGSFRRRIGLLERSSASSGSVIVAASDPGNGEVLDNWLTYGFGQRNISIHALSRDATDLLEAVTVFRGKVRGNPASSDVLNTLQMDIADRLTDLELPLLTERFAGTTTSTAATAEGNADLKGQIKQRVYGSASNVLLQPANVYDLIYLASNSTTSLISITVYDGGVALINDGDYATIALLRAATIIPGHYATCLADGLVRTGGTPAFNLTADIVEGADASARTAAQIAYRMLTDFGVDTSNIDQQSFVNLDADNDAVCYAVIDDDRTALDAVQQVLQSIGGWFLPNPSNVFGVGRFEEPVTAIASLHIDVELQSIGGLSLVSNETPVWRIVLEYGRIHHVQEDEALAGVVTAERRAYLATEHRTVTAEDSAVKTKHLDAKEIVVTTQIAEEADAQAEVNRLLALLSDERKVYNLGLSLADAVNAIPGASITLIHDRLGMTLGTNFLIISREDRFADERVMLEVWG